MAKFSSIFLICVVCQIFLFQPALVNANTFKLGSISVTGNNRLSDEAIVNYARLKPSSVLSSEDLNTAYNKVLETGLFRNVAFKQNGRDLIITVEEFPVFLALKEIDLSLLFYRQRLEVHF